MPIGSVFLRWYLTVAILFLSLPALNAGKYVVSTFAGKANTSGLVDGIGENARFKLPAGITVDGSRNLYITETGNHTIRKITPDGVVTTIAGGVSGFNNATGTAAKFKSPRGIAVDISGNLLVSDTGNHVIRKITSGGEVTTFAGIPGSLGYLDGLVATAKFTSPLAITVDSLGNVFIADTNNDVIRKITPSPAATVSSLSTGISSPSGLAMKGAHTIYISDTQNSLIHKFNTTTGQVELFGQAGAQFDIPMGVAVDSTGNVYVVDQNNNVIRKITPEGVITTIAGEVGTQGATDGNGPDARFMYPHGIAIDSLDNIYVTDWFNNTIRKIIWIPDPAAFAPTIEKASSTSGAAINGATTSAVSNATEGVGQAEGETEGEFRFSLSPERIKMGLGNMTGAFVGNKSYHANALSRLEKALGAAKAMKQISSDVTIWASGVYGQGQMKPMFTNPAAREKHYGIIMGSHYYHKPTKQMLGLAIDLGLGGSEVNTNHEMKNSYRSKQVTAYYGKGLGSDWNISIHGSFMRIDSSHHRPYTATNGYKGIAVSHSKAHVMSGMVEVSHKFKPRDNIHIKSSFGGIYGRTKQFAYKEHDAGANNQSYAASTMNEAGVKVGVKVSLFTKSTEHKTLGIYPQVNYTRYVKMGNVQQKVTSLNNGQSQLTKSGTAGKNLISVGIGAGVTDSENSTKTQVGYTANFQKYKKSHEFMMKYSVEF
jgi:sugar lactone lactonase YvrE